MNAAGDALLPPRDQPEALGQILYVSVNRIDPGDPRALAELQARSLDRNSALDLTGVLLATADNFAQYLEGNPIGLSLVMDSIRRDRRHSDLRIAPLAPLARRRFPAWRMACFAPGNFVARFMQPLLQGSDDVIPPTVASEIIRMMQGLAGQAAEVPRFDA